MSRIKCFFLFFILSVSSASSGQAFDLSKDTRISVLTCDTGSEIYALFGHTAIRVNDPAKHLDVVYNYGLFDFGTPNFVLKFTKGDLQYFIGTSTFDDFMYQYRYDQRSVYEQVLNISLEEKQKIFGNLNAALFSEDRFYTYKFIDRNCTNMAVAVLNKSLGGSVIYKRKNTDVTYRETLYPYFNGHFYEQLGTSIIFGAKVDKKATFLFLPTELMESLEVTTYQHHPLAEKATTLLDFKNRKSPFSWWNNAYTFLALLIFVVAVNKNFTTLFYLSIVGLTGLFFTFAGWYSLHEELAWNYNILLFNPVYLLLIYFYARNNHKWTYWTAAFLAFSTAVYLLAVISKVHLLITLPLVAANGILLWRLIRRSKKQLKVSV